MPSIIHSRKVPAFSSAKLQGQKRQNSTTQESRAFQLNGHTEAVLHGNIKSKGESSAINKPAAQPTNRAPPHMPKHGPDRRSSSTAHHRQSLPKQNPSTHPSEGRTDSRRKRKAENDISQRPSRRRATLQLKDEAHMRATKVIPTTHDYPMLSPGFFKNVKVSVINTLQGLAELRSEFGPLAEGAFECILHYTSAARNEVVIGEGRTHKAAETAAYLHLVANFHEQGVLAEVVDRKSGLNQINKQSIKKAREEERDAIMDIYNYAAHSDTVPKIRAQSVNIKARGRQKKYIDVTVELFEQGIQVTGRGSDRMAAEVKAGALFKREAEKYHAQRGSEAIIVKDSGALTTDNAAQFFEFYRILRPGISIETEAQPGAHISGTRQGLNRVQVKINGESVGEAVEMVAKRKAEDVAYLTAAISLRKREQDLYPRFLRALKSGNGQILKPVAPIDMNVDEDCSLVMRETLLGARKAGLPDEVDDRLPDVEVPENSRGHYRRQLTAAATEQKNWLLKRKLSDYLQDEKCAVIREKKAELPMNHYAAKVLDLVNANVYSIIVGATGSGKTTQVPQILLEEAISKGEGATCNIICTQPRRIAAVSVARRVAQEKGERLQESIGYQVRFDAKLPTVGGSVTYCTTGILLQQLQYHPDEVMEHNSHLVIDEVHERDMQIDFLLILLKKTVRRRKAQGKSVPRIVLMSATMDTELFASYFKTDAAGQRIMDCPSLNVPGRTFPVKEMYLDEIVKEMNVTSPLSQLQAMYLDPESKDFLDAEDRFRLGNPISTTSSSFQGEVSASKDELSVIDWKRERKLSGEDGHVSSGNEKEDGLIPFGLVACTIAHIAKISQAGAILVFLPGLAEINKVQETLAQHNFGVNFQDQTKFQIIMLHSSIADSQNTVFEPVPSGCRKIILATNIAETSVTIPDVQYVVDTGKLREKQYDQTRRISQLACTWISKSNAKQRAGRAGRVQNGNYYALYTKQRYETLRAIGLPELLRVDLQEICLTIKAQAFKIPIREFLAEAIEPPSPKSVDASVINLEALDALTDEEEITPLGRLLAALPVHPTLGKMIVLGIIFRCLDPMLILGAALAEGRLFVNPLGARAVAHESKVSFVQGSGSDHIALLNAFRELRHLRDERGENAMRAFAHRRYLHAVAFKTIDATAQQICDILVESGLIPQTRLHERMDSEYGHPSLNQNSRKVPLVKALALAGCHPNLAVNLGGRSFRTPGERGALVHPFSVNAPRDRRETGASFGTIYSYSALARSNDGNQLFLRDTTESTPLMASLFGGKLKRNEERGNILEIDSWLPFYVSSPDRRSAKTIIEFRKALERLLATAFKDLGQLSLNRKMGGAVDKDGKRAFLADQKVRELFAAGLVEVLDRDVKVEERTARRGWGAPAFTNANTNTTHGGVALSDRNTRTSKGGGERGGGKMPAFYEDLMRH